MLSDENLSPYAPIRLRSSPGWLWAQEYARAGWITRDGQIETRLYDEVDANLISPLVAGLVEMASDDDGMPPEALGHAIAKVVAVRDWVPLYAQYELAGRQIFDLHDRLTDMLVHTELGETTLQDLHLPYDAFFIRFGAQDTIKVPFDEDGHFEFLDGAFVAITPWEEEGGSRIKVGFTTVHEDGSGVGYPGPFFDFIPEERNLSVPAAIEAALVRRLARYSDSSADSETIRALNSHFRGFVEDSVEMVRAAAALLVNSLFYLESLERTFPPIEPGRDTPPDRQAKWLQTAPLKRDKQRAALSGDGYALVRILGQEVGDSATKGAGHGNVRVHWRRGHWRQQHHGAGSALVKRIWIKPVLVGKDARSECAAVPGHVYVPPPSNSAH